MNDSPMSTWDGNTLAGPLSEVFTAEMTAATARCRGCGHTGAVAELKVYGPDPGFVARCPGCADVLMRIVRTTRDVWIDLGGVSALRVSATA